MTARPRRRWFAYSLRTLFVAVILVAIAVKLAIVLPALLGALLAVSASGAISFGVLWLAWHAFDMRPQWLFHLASLALFVVGIVVGAFAFFVVFVMALGGQYF
jgi:hypothetical protein